MDLDRQSIERRDFPIARRGYDPATVDAHLRALAVEVEQLRQHAEAALRGGQESSPSLGSAAASQVQGILEATEATAAEMGRQATEDSAQMREEASQDAERTRTEAIQQAQAHVAGVAQATAVLLQRVESMDGEVGALVQSLHAGAVRLAADLGSVEANMGELYDAASGRVSTAPMQVPRPGEPVPAQSLASAPSPPLAAPAPRAPVAPPPTRPANIVPTTPPRPAVIAAPQPARAEREHAGGNGDIDGARLVALNMALNGESREQTDRYLSENFALDDRAKLLDEVYAAIEG